MSILTPAHLDHSRLWREFDYCYPVISRRSKGVSLGINLNQRKVCNFDCVYCEVDRHNPPKRNDIDFDQLECELRTLTELTISGEIFRLHPFSTAKEEARRFNDFAFSGDGEPTIATEFSEAVGRLATLKKSFGLHDVKIVLITNATRLQAPDVIKGIDTLMDNNGEIWAKLDAGTEAHYRTINRSGITLDEILANLLFAGKRWPLTIQTLFLEWDGSPPSGHELRQYINRLIHLLDSGIQIRGLQIYTIARPTPELMARPLTSNVLDDLASMIKNKLPDVPADVFYGPF